jgi:hypothetical protein
MQNTPLSDQIRACEEQKNFAQAWASQIEVYQHRLAAAQLKLQEQELEISRRENAVRDLEAKLRQHGAQVKADIEKKKEVQKRMDEASARLSKLAGAEKRRQEELKVQQKFKNLASLTRHELLHGVISGRYHMNVMNLEILPTLTKLSVWDYGQAYESEGCARLQICLVEDVRVSIRIACYWHDALEVRMRQDDIVLVNMFGFSPPTLMTYGQYLTRNDKPFKVQIPSLNSAFAPPKARKGGRGAVRLGLLTATNGNPQPMDLLEGPNQEFGAARLIPYVPGQKVLFK